MSSFWRLAGLNYLEYLSISTNAVRNSLKEPARARTSAREGAVHLREATWTAGKSGEKVGVESLSSPSRFERLLLRLLEVC